VLELHVLYVQCRTCAVAAMDKVIFDWGVWLQDTFIETATSLVDSIDHRNLVAGMLAPKLCFDVVSSWTVRVLYDSAPSPPKQLPSPALSTRNDSCALLTPAAKLQLLNAFCVSLSSWVSEAAPADGVAKDLRSSGSSGAPPVPKSGKWVSKDQSTHTTQEFSCKIVVIGDMGTGKSSLVSQFMGRGFTGQYVRTQWDTEEMAAVSNGTIRANCRIVDTSTGVCSIPPQMHFSRAGGVLIVFSVTDGESLRRARVLLTEVRQARPSCPVVLVGNKSDLGCERRVTVEEVMTLAAERGVAYFEISAKCDVDAAALPFHDILNGAWQQQQQHQSLHGSQFSKISL